MDFLTHKRGASLLLLACIPARFPDGYFTAWVPSAQVRSATSDALVAQLDVAWADAATARVLRVSCLDTTAWPLGKLEFDVRLTDPQGFVVPSGTVRLNIVKDITRD